MPEREYSKLSRILALARERVDGWIMRVASRYGYAPYMISRYLEALGSRDSVVALLEANEEPMPETIRCNDHLIDCQHLKELLEGKGYELERIPFLPHGFHVTRVGVGSIGATHEYLKGYYYIQDPASMSIVYSLDPRPGETVADFAAAPGGKSTQILQLMKDTGFLVAIEKNPRRIRSLRSNLARMRFRSYAIILADATKVELPIAFDRVLVDAPSTGEGIIRKDPKRKTSRAPEDLAHIHEIQYAMLERALDSVRPGGIVVYSACTLAPEEGELVVDRILSSREDVEVEHHGLIAEPGVVEYFGEKLDEMVSRCGRFWPHVHGTDGFFVCRLRRVEN